VLPDHPYVKEDREWFRERPDGTVAIRGESAQEIPGYLPFDFESKHAPELWEELKSIVVYWAEQGFRVFAWTIRTLSRSFFGMADCDVKRDYPDVIFLSEAFTRENHVPAGETRVHPVLYVLCVEKYERGFGEIFHGIDPNTGS